MLWLDREIKLFELSVIETGAVSGARVAATALPRAIATCSMVKVMGKSSVVGWVKR